MTRQAVFLDRDGVLNNVEIRGGVTHPPADAAAMRILPRAAEAVRRLKAAGYLCICVTNQPDIARGARTPDNVRAMNETVRRAMPLDDLYCCPHDRGDNCLCRKPKPGMLLEAAAKWDIALAESWMVGDRDSDIAAGRSAGCKTVLVAADAATRDFPPNGGPDLVVASLWDGVEHILHTI